MQFLDSSTTVPRPSSRSARAVSQVPAPCFGADELLHNYLSTPFDERDYHQDNRCHCALQFGQCVHRRLAQPETEPPPTYAAAMAADAAAAAVSASHSWASTTTSSSSFVESRRTPAVASPLSPGKQFRLSLQTSRQPRQSTTSDLHLRIPSDSDLQHWVDLQFHKAQTTMDAMRDDHESRRRQRRGGSLLPHEQPAADGATLAAPAPAADSTAGSGCSGLPKRHPLLNSVVSDMFQVLPSIYRAGPVAKLGIDVELRVDVAMSRRNLHAPIQLALHALRSFEQDEEVVFYGGIPLHNDLIRRVGQEMRLPFACSHARSINNVDFSLDGLPLAWMIHRPVPGSLARLLDIANRGVACLLPHLRDGYTRAEKAAFVDSPLGYMVNSAGDGQTNNLKIKWRRVGGLYEIPVLAASRPIHPGEQLLCPYNNEEHRRWVAAERSRRGIDSTPSAAGATRPPVRLFSSTTPPAANNGAPRRQASRSDGRMVQRTRRKRALIDHANAAGSVTEEVDEEAVTEPDNDDDRSISRPQSWSAMLADVVSAVAAPVRRLSAFMRRDSSPPLFVHAEPAAAAQSEPLPTAAQTTVRDVDPPAHELGAPDEWLQIADHDSCACQYSMVSDLQAPRGVVQPMVAWIAQTFLDDAKSSQLVQQHATTLNNVYLFHLHLCESPRRISPAIVVQLERLIESNRERLQQHYARSVEAPTAAGGKGTARLFDRQQQLQFRLVYARDAQTSARTAPSSSDDNTLTAAEQASLTNFCAECRLVPPASAPDHSFDDWKPSYVQSYAKLFDSLSSLVCFISIDAGHGNDPRLAFVCRRINPLWQVLLERNLLPRWAALISMGPRSRQWDTKKGAWAALVSSALYLATHCVFAQTLYQTKGAKHIDQIVDYADIAQLLADPVILGKLKEWRHAELLTEIIAVLQLDKRRHEAIVADIWQWLAQQWALQPMADRLENTLNRVDPLHLIATLVMALPPASTPGVGIETHSSTFKPKEKRRVADALLAASVVNKRLKLVDSRHDSVTLTLQPSAASWPQQSLPSSAVRLLPVVPLDQLQSTMAKQGVAHIADALSTELVNAIVTEMLPWLDGLCARPTKGRSSQQGAGVAQTRTGATVEFLAHGEVRECESNTMLEPRHKLPSFALLDEVLRDGRLQATARHAFGLDAHTDIHPHVYLRIRHPQHYTRLHSDYSFFLEHQLLDPHGAHSVGEEPVCTVWIPLRPCGPQSGALLLLPDTRTLPQPSEMQANNSVPKSFQRAQWKKIGQSDGYSVSSARMQAGSALLFGPTVVHGGALRAADSASAAPRYSIDIRLVRRSSTTAPPPSTPPAGPLVGIELNPGPVVCSPAASAVAVDYSPAPRLSRGILKRWRPDDSQPDDVSRTPRRRGVAFAELLTQVRVFESQPPDVPMPLPMASPAAQWPPQLESFDSVRLWLINNPLRPPPECQDDIGTRGKGKSKGNSSSPPLSFMFHRSNTWCLYGDEQEGDSVTDHAASPARSGAHASDSVPTASVALVDDMPTPSDPDPLVVEEDGFFLRLEW